MTMQILKETLTRREYKTKWQTLSRAKQALKELLETEGITYEDLS